MDLKSEILTLLSPKDAPAPTAKELASLLGAQEKETAAAADALVEEGWLVFNRKKKLVTPEKDGYLRGEFSRAERGFGFVLSPDGEDVFIPPDSARDAMDRDTVLAKRTGRSPKGPEGLIERILERGTRDIAGVFVPGAPNLVKPDSRRQPPVEVLGRNTGGAADGDKVLCRITRYPKNGMAAQGEIFAVLGRSDSLGANYKSLLYTHQVRIDFPQEVLDAAAASSARPVTAEGRIDLRDKVIFTIDSETSKDLDDAVSLEKDEKGDWLLGVHIADVSEYVPDGGVIDQEAFLRGTSVYFTDKVVPMLPKDLSNGSCSLNEGVERYTLSAFMHINAAGEIVDSSFGPSVIRSAKKGVYEKINRIFVDKEEGEVLEEYRPLVPHIAGMLELAAVLRRRRMKLGSLDLESSEAYIYLDEAGEPVDIVKRVQGEAEKMIEELMLCANEAVAAFLTRSGAPCVFRVHENPDPEKIKSFLELCSVCGIDVRGIRAEKVTPLVLQGILEKTKKSKYALILNNIALRSLAKARYATEGKGHFGLAKKDYCHFTSPIRRYPDLLVHRALKSQLAGMAPAVRRRYAEFFPKAAIQSSECEVRSMSAERDIEDLYKVIYMQRHVGGEFDGVISSVNSFGAFVMLDNTVEGLVRVSDMEGYYVYDEKRMTLTCGRKVLSVGDKVRVRVAKADVAQRRIDMVFI